eukprot:CAMPEP_0198726924 /NCGR_PEP_ID=MMETSP1475-20131203/3821_1 /TAXON_ID= ORGANISM="Unidentified sp., Strain CCMP1999" /NCGR_SAMPLE_ID=MMETSP1475 /ASSEMBLY_ACC=CAM_ASM_001111 /LENGTH=469 /DNA_ID=CAMNT_0044488901 /DNA_START=87 /DNA_END=1496 /DNA_ORIENTATION=-
MATAGYERVEPQADAEQEQRELPRNSGLDSEAEMQLGERKRWVMIGMIALVTALIFADQNLMAPNLTAIAEEFGLTMQQRDWYLGGMLSTLFFLIGAPASVAAGYLTDTRSRKTIFIGVALLGAIPCALTSFVQTPKQLFFTRMFTGASLGGFIPVTFSLLGDLFPSSQRVLVSGGFGVVAGVGQGAGQLMAGITGHLIGWRACFLAVGIPGILAATAMSFIVTEPRRGAFDGSQKTRPEIVDIKLLGEAFTVRTNMLIFLQACFGCLPWGMIIAFLNDYLAQDSGLGVLNASLVLTVFGAGASAGGIAGAFLGQHYQNTQRYKIGLLMGLTTIGGIPPLLYMILVDGQKTSIWAYCVASVIGGVLASPTGANINAVLMNTNTPETRGSVFAVYNLCNDVGKGLGPLIGAFLIQGLGRRLALAISMLGWLPCGLACLCLMVTYPRDEDRMLQNITETSSDDFEMDSEQT